MYPRRLRRLEYKLCVKDPPRGIKYSMKTLYRIYDSTSQNILANAIPSLKQAEEVVRLLQLDFPSDEMVIETYTQK